MISINVNSAASASGLNLGKTNDALQKSLQRLSSGSRIVTSSDDAGGLAVSMKMSAALKRTEATAINLQNAKSYLQTQDGAFKVADKVLSRMSELATLANDPTKNSGDIALYNKEFQNLRSQLVSLATEKFNGVPLFGTGSSPSGFHFGRRLSNSGHFPSDILGGAISASVIERHHELTGASAPTDTVTIQNAIQYLAELRAQNGAEESRVNFAMDMLKINAINLEAANSRIIDVDVAAESTQLARYQILQQAGTAMLAQANTSQQTLVRLLQG
jgi:flagellin